VSEARKGLRSNESAQMKECYKSLLATALGTLSHIQLVQKSRPDLARPLMEEALAICRTGPTSFNYADVRTFVSSLVCCVQFADLTFEYGVQLPTFVALSSDLATALSGYAAKVSIVHQCGCAVGIDIRVCIHPGGVPQLGKGDAQPLSAPPQPWWFFMYYPASTREGSRPRRESQPGPAFVQVLC
jgi:hypothetical protein